MRRMIYDGDSFYELDEDCLKKKEDEERQKEISWQLKNRKQGNTQTKELPGGRKNTRTGKQADVPKDRFRRF